ncbi:MAG: alpha/beta hydrolase [Pirellulales bacterium]
MFVRAVLPAVACLACCLFAIQPTFAAEPTVIPLWDGQAPGEKGPLAAAEGDQAPNPKDGKPVQRRQNVSVPTLTVYPADPAKANGASVVIAPGGGYNILAWDLEGTEVAEWLNGQGVTAFVLKYRVPKRADDPTNKLPFMDAQRAIRIVRSRAAEWKLDTARIGMLGFSAGGNLTAKTALRPDETSYEPVDATDKVSAASGLRGAGLSGVVGRQKRADQASRRVSGHRQIAADDFHSRFGRSDQLPEQHRDVPSAQGGEGADRTAHLHQRRPRLRFAAEHAPGLEMAGPRRRLDDVARVVKKQIIAANFNLDSTPGERSPGVFYLWCSNAE